MKFPPGFGLIIVTEERLREIEIEKRLQPAIDQEDCEEVKRFFTEKTVITQSIVLNPPIFEGVKISYKSEDLTGGKTDFLAYKKEHLLTYVIENGKANVAQFLLTTMKPTEEYIQKCLQEFIELKKPFGAPDKQSIVASCATLVKYKPQLAQSYIQQVMQHMKEAPELAKRYSKIQLIYMRFPISDKSSTHIDSELKRKKQCADLLATGLDIVAGRIGILQEAM